MAKEKFDRSNHVGIGQSATLTTVRNNINAAFITTIIS